MNVDVEPTSARQPKRFGRFRFRLKSLLLLVLICAITLSCIPLFRDSSGTNVSRADAPISRLPENASNVSYFIPGALGPCRLYEFDTDEDSFHEWARTYSVNLETDGYCRILRYTAYLHGPETAHYADINDGILYTRVDGRDSGINIAYDRKAGRAYFFYHSR